MSIYSKKLIKDLFNYLTDFFLFKTVKCQVTGKKGTIKSIK